MDHPDFIVCILMENSIGPKRVKHDLVLLITVLVQVDPGNVPTNAVRQHARPSATLTT